MKTPLCAEVSVYRKEPVRPLFEASREVFIPAGGWVGEQVRAHTEVRKKRACPKGSAQEGRDFSLVTFFWSIKRK